MAVAVEIATGTIIADTRFENDERAKPVAFNLWNAEFQRLKREDFFSNIGTFAIDSLTTFSDAVVAEVLKRAGRPGGDMQMKDWGSFLNAMNESVSAILNLPCDVIMTGHLQAVTDEISGKTEAMLLISGQSKDRLPLLFDEMYVTQSKETRTGIEYSLLTANTGYYRARTRIGAGKFFTVEPPDIKALLKKAGLPSEDKPLFV